MKFGILKSLNPFNRLLDKALNIGNEILDFFKNLPGRAFDAVSELGSRALDSVTGAIGFAEGGFTGGGAIDDVAGIVHKNEFVVPAWMNDSFSGLFGTLENMRTGGGSTKNINVDYHAAGSSFDEQVFMNNLIFKLKTI